jgi:hypothetical protein
LLSLLLLLLLLLLWLLLCSQRAPHMPLLPAVLRTRLRRCLQVRPSVAMARVRPHHNTRLLLPRVAAPAAASAGAAAAATAAIVLCCPCLHWCAVDAGNGGWHTLRAAACHTVELRSTSASCGCCCCSRHGRRCRLLLQPKGHRQPAQSSSRTSATLRGLRPRIHHQVF